jgi:hypothetical protein
MNPVTQRHTGKASGLLKVHPVFKFFSFPVKTL